MSNLKAVILAAGKGTRMKSELPKVVHTIDGKCLADYVIEAAKGAGVQEVCLVVGYEKDKVQEMIADQDVIYMEQAQQLGTGHAVKCAKEFLADGDGQTMILFGDTPLITKETLDCLHEYHTNAGNTVTVLSAYMEDATGYGRIIRDGAGEFLKSVEHKDATDDERESHEVNSGMYLYETKDLCEALELLKNHNAQGEYYLPDTLEIIRKKGKKVDAFMIESAEDITGVNDLEQLEAAEAIIRRRKACI
ncbi:MAG: sugar phosphate nucleotidyltransferase [Lachnospiraceae bacterium]